MTTQSPHLYARKPASRVAPARAVPARTAAGDDGRAPGGVQTRLPWWAVALPVLAFVALLTLLSGAARDGATDAASGGEVLARVATAVPDFISHVL